MKTAPAWQKSRTDAVVVLLLATAGLEIVHVGPGALLWTGPAILAAAILIAWAAESAQFFIAQGFALAILAWLQTLPEFAIEAVLAWKRQTPFLLANLTGALRLLTGLGWPMIYAVAAFFYKRRYSKPMLALRLDRDNCVSVIGLVGPLIYVSFIWWKATLTIWDAAVLTLLYLVYLFLLSKAPPEEEEGIENLERIPRFVVTSAPVIRITLIALLFACGGALIYFTAERFLGSLLAVSAVFGVPSFVFIQWIAPFVSEFPEKVSAFYWARTVDRAPMALMNMVSSNINQWTLLMAMLPIVFSISAGAAVPIEFNSQQRLELLMTLGQSLVGLFFLVNMELAWWEAAVLFCLWALQFAFSPVPLTAPGMLGFMATHIHAYVTAAYFIWSGVELARLLMGRRRPLAFHLFAEFWRTRVLSSAPAGLE